MIINHQHKFLFVHIHKTAGSSIRNSLLEHVPGSCYLGYDHSFINQVPDLEIYKDYFKFCVVRNPWDRLVSWYYSILDLRWDNSFKLYIQSRCSDFSGFLKCKEVVSEINAGHYGLVCDNELLKKFPDLPYLKSISFNQLDYVSNTNGDILVDYIGRFEDIEGSWNYICNKISLNVPLRKDKVGPTRSHYRDFYDFQDKELVSSMYEKDIKYFGYTF